MNTTDTRTCPRCLSVIDGYPALSRTDGLTDICSNCGVSEGMEAMLHGEPLHQSRWSYPHYNQAPTRRSLTLDMMDYLAAQFDAYLMDDGEGELLVTYVPTSDLFVFATNRIDTLRRMLELELPVLSETAVKWKAVEHDDGSLALVMVRNFVD